MTTTYIAFILKKKNKYRIFFLTYFADLCLDIKHVLYEKKGLFILLGDLKWDKNESKIFFLKEL
jgi:hypothetical protein